MVLMKEKTNSAMTRNELQSYLASWQSDLPFSDEGTQYLEVTVDKDVWHEFAIKLRDDEQTKFDFLFCLTAVDWPKHLSVVYHLESTLHRHILVVKVNTADREDVALDSVYDIWPTAELHEREAYDLMGIQFKNHPNLKRIFLDEHWVGHPLRKDYVDEVNIVVK